MLSVPTKDSPTSVEVEPEIAGKTTFYLPTLTVEQLHEVPLGFMGGSHSSRVGGELSVMACSLHERSHPNHRVNGLSIATIVLGADCPFHLLLVDRNGVIGMFVLAKFGQPHPKTWRASSGLCLCPGRLGVVLPEEDSYQLRAFRVLVIATRGAALVGRYVDARTKEISCSTSVSVPSLLYENQQDNRLMTNYLVIIRT